MGELLGPDGTSVRIPDRCLVGRSRACDLRLSGGRVSGEHARLRWSQGRWALEDLGSKNGTWIGDNRLSPGQREPLAVGDTLAFGDRDAAWTVASVAAPTALVHDLDGDRWLSAEDGLLAIPSVDAPEATLYRGPMGNWVLESDRDVQRVEDRQQIECAGRRWLLRLTDAIPDTTEAISSWPLVSGTLRFTVSRDQEHVVASLVFPGGTVELGARAHHGLLLELARERLRDRRSGDLAEPERGWTFVELLCDRLRTEQTHLNILVHRARRQLARAGVVDGAAIVERRVGTGQLRLGPTNIELVE